MSLLGEGGGGVGGLSSEISPAFRLAIKKQCMAETLGQSKTIVFDRNSKFIGNLWRALLEKSMIYFKI